MLKIPLATAVILTTTAASAMADITVLSVPSDQYPTIAAAVAAVNKDTNLNNDYVISIAPGTYTNDTAEVDRPMTIQAAVPGSAVILNETAPLPNEKGILLAFASLTVDGLTFQNAAISNDLGGNGAGIRDQDTTDYDTLTVRNSTFINNQMGILTSNSSTDNILLENNVFMNNGNPDINYFGHAIYIGPANSLIASGNEVCGTNIGHDIKSRAAINIIQNNTFYDGAADPNQPSCNIGSTSFALDLPNGGQAVVTGNTMVQGAATQNGTMFAYGEEGLIFAVNSIYFSNNRMKNSGVSGAIAIYDNPNTPIPVEGSNNIFDPSLTEVDPASANELTGTFSPGTYLIGGSYVIDGGFYQAYWGYPPAAEVYPNNQPNPWQQFVFATSGSGFTICDVSNGACLTDGGTVVDIGQGVDTWAIQTSSSGWTLRNNRTGNYMGSIPTATRANIQMSSSPVPVTLTAILSH